MAQSAATKATKTMKQMLRTRGAVVAAVTAGAVGAWLFLENLAAYAPIVR